MNEKLLVITDNTDGRWLRHLKREIEGCPRRVSVLALGVTAEDFRRSSSCKFSELLKECDFLDVSSVSEEAQRRVGEFYINFMFDLSCAIPPEYFIYKGKNLWWFLEMTEKSVARSRIINRLFCLDLVQYFVKEDKFLNIYIDLDDRFVARALLDWKSGKIRNLSDNMSAQCRMLFSQSVVYFLGGYIKNCIGVFSLFFVRSFAFNLNGVKGLMPLKRDGVYFFTNFPFWWNNPYSDKASEKFFGSLPKSLFGNHPVYYASILYSMKPAEIFLKNRYLKRFFTENKIVLLERLLKAREKASVLSFGYLGRALSARRYFKKSFKARYGEFDITQFVSYEISRSLSRPEFFTDILTENIMRNFAIKYSPRAVIYRAEFQPFEKAILAGIEKRCKTIAFQHSTFSRNYLSHFFARGEIAFDLAENKARLGMPLPDVILTNGVYYHDILINSGFPADRVDVCGPVRYHSLVSYLKKPTDRTEARNRLGFSHSEKVFLVAMNSIEKEVKALVSALIEATDGINSGLHFVFRSTPNKKYDRDVKAYIENQNPNFKYSFLKDSFYLYDLIIACDGLVQVSTTIGYEAVALGKVPILYENMHLFNLNSSEELKGCVPITRSSEELRRALTPFLNADEAAGLAQDKRHAVLRKFFDNLEQDPQNRFVELLKKHDVLDFSAII